MRSGFAVFLFCVPPRVAFASGERKRCGRTSIDGGVALVREEGVFEPLHVIGGRRRMNKQCNVTSTE